MRRAKWKSAFEASEILPFAKAWVEYHRRHEAYWAGRHAVKAAEMKETARTEWTPVTGGEQGVIRYDQGLQQQVNDANNRRNSHKAEAEAYEAYVLMFEQRDTQDFALDVQDVAYFFTVPPVDDLLADLPVIVLGPKDDLLESAWGIIANANEGNWDDATPEWRAAAERWRDQYHDQLEPELVDEEREIGEDADALLEGVRKAADPDAHPAWAEPGEPQARVDYD